MAPVPPPFLHEIAPEWQIDLAYVLIPTKTTWRMRHPDGRLRFAKVDSAGCFPTLQAEGEHMVWAAPYLPIPTVVEVFEHEQATVLVTEALPGRDGTDEVWRHDLPSLVSALGRGLAAFHRAVDEEWCPFRFENEHALDHVATRVEDGAIDPAGFHEVHRHLSPTQALAQLRDSAPKTEDLVVCHGDYCPPNALLTSGVVTGYVDLGELAVADRWRDIAVGGWSTVWNFGAEYESLFYESYGIDPDADRIRFYRLLWEMVS
jgi:kanamycin kinase